MAKYTCIKKCFIRDRVWSPGETLDSDDPSEFPSKTNVLLKGRSLQKLSLMLRILRLWQM